MIGVGHYKKNAQMLKKKRNRQMDHLCNKLNQTLIIND